MITERKLLAKIVTCLVAVILLSGILIASGNTIPENSASSGNLPTRSGSTTPGNSESGTPGGESNPGAYIPPSITIAPVPPPSVPPATPPNAIASGLRTPNPQAGKFNAASFTPRLVLAGTRNGLFALSADGIDEKAVVLGTPFSTVNVAPDGKWLTALRTDPLSRKVQMALVNPAGEVKIIVPEAEGVFLSAVWSPDSKRLVLARGTDTNGDNGVDDADGSALVLYEIETGRQTELVRGRGVAWSPDGARFVFLQNPPVSDQIDPATRQLKRAANALAVYNLSTKQTRVLVEAANTSVSLGKAAHNGISPEAKLAVRYFRAAAWHPDNKTIAVTADLASNVAGNSLLSGAVFTLTLADATPQLITAGGDGAGGLAWSPEGNWLAYELEPRYPVNKNSARQVALYQNISFEAGSIKEVLGKASNRTEARQPRWLDKETLVYLEGDNGTLAVRKMKALEPLRLFSGCLSFGVNATQP